MAPSETRSEPRPEKVEAVRDIAGRFNDSDAALLTEYRGLRVQEIAEVRNALREAGAEYKVLKNTLARIAVKEVGLEDLAELLEGPVAIAFISGDAAAAAKALDEAAKKYPVLEVKGGVLLGKIIDASEAQRLARLESREILLSKVAMLANSPTQQTVNVFSALLRNFGSMLAQVVAQKSESAPDTDEPVPSAEVATPSGDAPGAEAEGGGDAPTALGGAEDVGEPTEDASTGGVEESGEEAPQSEDAGQPEDATPTAEAAELPEASEQAEAAPESSAAAAVGGADTALSGAISDEAAAEEVEPTSGAEEEQ